MFAGVLDACLGDVDENGSCKKLSLFEGKLLLQGSFSINL